jgi:hypothetical protein
MSDQPIDTTGAPAPQPTPQIPQQPVQPVQQQPVEQAPPVQQPVQQPVEQAPPVQPAPVPAVVQQPTAVQTYTEPQSLTSGVAGLEDVDASDLSMPRINIMHTETKWEDSLSGEQFTELDVILLGLIKQRVLWPSEVGEDSEAPLCRSYNYTLGNPGEKFSVRESRDPQSPLDASGFSAVDIQRGQLSCAECNLKDWGSHPSRDVPWCVEQYVFAVMMTDPGEPIGTPAMLTLQRSAIKPARAYITSFVRAKKPLFVARTTLKLDGRQRGSVRYAVPKFVKGEATDADFHMQYAEFFRQVKDFVTAPRTQDDAETGVTVSAGVQAQQPVQPVQQPMAASTVEEDLPF